MGRGSVERVRARLRSLPLRVHIILWTVATLLPIFAAAMLFVLQLAAAEREVEETQILDTAQAVSTAIDLKIQNAQGALLALSTSFRLKEGDLETFREQCAEVALQHGSRILLTDAAGKEIFKTTDTPGSEAPPEPLAKQIAAALASRRPQVSDLYRGRTSQVPHVATIVPVVSKGTPYALLMGFGTEMIQQQLTRNPLPESWTVSVIDRNGVLLARNKQPEQYTARPGTPELLAEIAQLSPEPWASRNVAADGRHTVLARSMLSGWVTAVQIPLEIVDAPLRQSLLGLAAVGLLTLLVAIAAAIALGRIIERSMRSISAAALGLGTEPPVPVGSSIVREVAEVIETLAVADGLLRCRDAERNDAAAALRDSEARLARAQAIASLGSWELDLATGRFLWSEQMYRIRGMPANFTPTAEAVTRLVHPDDVEVYQHWLDQLAQGRNMPGIEYRILTATGDTRIATSEGQPIRDASGHTIKVSGVLQDISLLRQVESRRRDLENQLHHSQRLESLGTLAGGIAHDLNNTLVPILAFAKMQMRQTAPDAPQRAAMEAIYQAAIRARDLVRQILAFGRKGSEVRVAFEPAVVIREVMQLLRASLPSTIQLEDEIEDTAPILGDPGQLHQVVTNLMTNSAHAIGDEKGTIGVRLRSEPERGVAKSVRITISDTGHGMNEEIRARIFEPFFTTKPVGEGTGLGLSVVHGIVTSYGGTIGCRSEAGRGTSFDIVLPVCGERNATQLLLPARLSVA